LKIKLREPIFSDHAESLEEKLRTLLREECVQADIEDSITGNTTSTDDRDEDEEGNECTICGATVEPSEHRKHLAQHNPNVDNFDPEDVAKFYR
jgi:hypothetical protein